MEALETVGSAEAILQLLLVYGDACEADPNPYDVWVTISRFIESSPATDQFRFSSYVISNHNSRRPAGAYLADLAELVDSGFIKPLPTGNVQITPAGRAVAMARSLPKSLHPLRLQLESAAQKNRRH